MTESPFTSERFPDQTLGKAILNPRRGAMGSVPGLDLRRSDAVMSVLFMEEGLNEYVGCVTGEMRSRPVPQAVEAATLLGIEALFRKEVLSLYERMRATIKPVIQPLAKESRLGWPYFAHAENKREILLQDFPSIVEDPVSWTEGAFVITNVRLQQESVLKKRNFQFIDDEGFVYDQQISWQDRVVKSSAGERIGARTRLVFNYPVPNLLKQIGDSAINTWLMQWPLWHHNTYDLNFGARGQGEFYSFDVRHMERTTAAITRARGELIGGGYHSVQNVLLGLPYLVRSDTQRTVWLIKPKPKYLVQFGSGDSSVAPSQKELFFCLYNAFCRDQLRMGSDSVDFVLGGGGPSLAIFNYGDDNLFRTPDPGLAKDLISFMGSLLPVERDDVPSFLGSRWNESLKRFCLKKESYLLKTYLNERPAGGNFRKYPFFGWREKRKVYGEYGEPGMARVFNLENILLAEAGLTWDMVEKQAAAEAAELADLARRWQIPAWAVGKDYLLTAEEKIGLGLYDGLTLEEVLPYYEYLLGKFANV